MIPQVAVKSMWTSSDLCLAVFMMPASARFREPNSPKWSLAGPDDSFLVETFRI